MEHTLHLSACALDGQRVFALPLWGTVLADKEWPSTIWWWKNRSIFLSSRLAATSHERFYRIGMGWVCPCTIQHTAWCLPFQCRYRKIYHCVRNEPKLTLSTRISWKYCRALTSTNGKHSLQSTTPTYHRARITTQTLEKCPSLLWARPLVEPARCMDGWLFVLLHRNRFPKQISAEPQRYTQSKKTSAKVKQRPWRRRASKFVLNRLSK